MKRILHTAILFAFAFSIQTSNAQWTGLGTGLVGYGLASVVYHGELVVGGTFTSADGVSANNIAKWDGANWSALTTGVSYGNTAVRSLAVYHDTLYVAGQFGTAGGVNVLNIAKWDGTTWSAVGGGIGQDYYNDVVHSMCVYDDKLYVGGSFDFAGGDTANFQVASWDGTEWSAVGRQTNVNYYVGNVKSIASYHDNLYMAAAIQYIGSGYSTYALKWNGTTWVEVGTSIETGGAGKNTNALVVYDDKLYAGGHFDNKVAYWDDAVWTALPTTTDDDVFALTTMGSDLYVGGSFNNVSSFSAKNVAKWDGTDWSTVGQGMDGYVFSLTDYGNQLHAIGYFTNADGQVVNNVARFGTVVTGLNDNVDGTLKIDAFPNPATELLTINVQSKNTRSLTIRMFSETGQLLINKNVESLKDNYTERLNVSTFAKGMYFIHFITDETTSVKKVVIQ